MHFSKLAVFLPLFLSAGMAAPQTGTEPAPVPVDEPETVDVNLEDLVSRSTDMVKRGFGCPFNRQECNDHCITLKGGRTGGYCAGTFRTTCTCIFG